MSFPITSTTVVTNPLVTPPTTTLTIGWMSLLRLCGIWAFGFPLSGWGRVAGGWSRVFPNLYEKVSLPWACMFLFRTLRVTNFLSSASPKSLSSSRRPTLTSPINLPPRQETLRWDSSLTIRLSHFYWASTMFMLKSKWVPHLGFERPFRSTGLLSSSS